MPEVVDSVEDSYPEDNEELGEGELEGCPERDSLSSRGPGVAFHEDGGAAPFPVPLPMGLVQIVQGIGEREGELVCDGGVGNA